MYLAKTSNTLKSYAPFYINILKDIIQDNNSPQKPNIDSAIIEAKEVANGSREVITIGINNYYFVITLLTKFREKLPEISQDDLNNDTYKEILEVLK